LRVFSTKLRYGPYAYYGPYGVPGRSGRGVSYGRYGVSYGRYAATPNGPGRRAAEVCSNQAPELTGWPIERISEVVQPTDVQRPALDELRAASAKAISTCSSPGAQKTCRASRPDASRRLRVGCRSMLDDVQTVRPALERFYQSLSNEQKARFNAIAPAGDPDAAGKDQRDFTKFCDDKR
jgi:LTXXQ motif family protein